MPCASDVWWLEQEVQARKRHSGMLYDLYNILPPRSRKEQSSGVQSLVIFGLLNQLTLSDPGHVETFTTFGCKS